jgi:hypothetical protein
MERYQEFIDSALTSNINCWQTLYPTARQPLLEELRERCGRCTERTYAFNMLNTKYIIIDPGTEPLVNDKVLGNAWFVEKPGNC